LLAASNRNMAKEVAAGRFREDLFYRINVMSLHLPPLRDRRGDIPLLVEHFLGTGWTVDPRALAVIEAYHWPGNVRQLINAIDRAKIMSDDQVIYAEDLPPDVLEARSNNGRSIAEPLGDDLAGIERAHVIEVFNRERGNKSRTARALGINRRSLYRLLEKYSVTWPESSHTAGAD